MDIKVYCDINIFKQIVEKLQFTPSQKNGYYSVIYSSQQGRYHLLFTADGAETFCEIHFDKTIHLLFFGVDYIKKPLPFFKKHFKAELERRKIRYSVKNTSWRERRNIAILTGFSIRH